MLSVICFSLLIWCLHDRLEFTEFTIQQIDVASFPTSLNCGSIMALSDYLMSVRISAHRLRFFFVPNYANFISTLIARMHHGTSGQHRKKQVNPHGSLWSNYVLFDLCLKWWYVNVLSCVCRIWCSFLPFGLYWPCHFWKYPSWYFSGHLSCFSSDRYFLQDFSRFYHNLLLVHCRSYFLPLESISSVCTLL